MVSSRLKQRHKRHLSAVYVAPEWRGSGLAHDLLTTIIQQARVAGLRSLTLSVTTGHEAATRLYLRAGSEQYGIEPRSLRTGANLLDEALMALLWIDLYEDHMPS